MPEAPSESIYEHAGGEAGIRKIVQTFYDSIFTDPVLLPVFGHPHATHVDHLTAFLSEEFGGPRRYTEELGGFDHIIAVHRPLKIKEPQRQRFIELFMAAVEANGFAEDKPFMSAIRSAIEFGTEVALVNSNAETDEQLHPQRTIPLWRWEP